jgi:hypothetical protein
MTKNDKRDVDRLLKLLAVIIARLATNGHKKPAS